MEEQKNGDEIFPLDDAAIQMIQELRQQARSAEVALNSILMYFARQHNLTGQLQLAPNDREIVIKQQRLAPQAQPGE